MSDIQVQGSTFGDFRDFVSDTEVIITPYLQGFVNIEGGELSIAGGLFPSCEKCNGYSRDSIFVSCDACGRNPENYVSVRSGDGDGMYGVFMLHWGDRVRGSLTILSPTIEFAGPFSVVVDQISRKEAEVKALWDLFWNHLSEMDRSMEINFLCTLTGQPDTINREHDPQPVRYFLADSGVGSDPDSVVASFSVFSGAKQDVFIFSKRAPENQNALIPKIVLTLEPELAREIGLPSGELTLDLGAEAQAWSNATVSASVMGSQALAAAAVNYTYQMTLKEAGVWQGDQLSEAMINAVSWRAMHDLLQNGELSDAVKTLAASLMNAEFMWTILTLRGFTTLASEYFDPVTGEEGPAYLELKQQHSAASSSTGVATPARQVINKPLGAHLPKSSPDLSAPSDIPRGQDALSAPRDAEVPQANFCTECGTQFVIADHRFCTACGAPRA